MEGYNEMELTQDPSDSLPRDWNTPIVNLTIGQYMELLKPGIQESVSSTVLAAVTTAVQPLKDAVEVNSSRIERLESENLKLQKLAETQKSTLDEERRKKNIVIFGWPVLAKSNADLVDMASHFFQEYLEVSVSPSEINSARKIGKNKNKENESPPILVSLVSFNTKLKIMGKATLLKGTALSISNDYSQDTIKKRKELLPILKELKENNLQAKMRDAYLYVENKIISKEAALALIKQTKNKKRPREVQEVEENSASMPEMMSGSSKNIRPPAPKKSKETPGSLRKYLTKTSNTTPGTRPHWNHQ